jgi:NH3-dependent NAD+ synthetase
MPVIEPESLIDERAAAIRRYHEDTGVERAQLDVSGGVDSAVMAGLLALALGPEAVVLSHTTIDTDAAQTRRAEDLAASIGCRLAIGEFTETYRLALSELMRSLDAAGYDREEIEERLKLDPTVEGSIRSTLRAPIGRAYNRLTGGGIRHGTGNECEDRFLRFYQKGGDGEVDTNPIAMLSKTEVYQLALAIAGRLDAREGYGPIIGAVPSPDLWGTGDGHTDEGELLTWTGAPFTYGRLDAESGRIVSFGTIEMVCRFVDSQEDRARLFDDSLTDADLDALVESARTERARRFPGVEPGTIGVLLRAARRIERTTRHKMNPNIPALGCRAELLEQGILSDELVRV